MEFPSDVEINMENMSEEKSKDKDESNTTTLRTGELVRKSKWKQNNEDL